MLGESAEEVRAPGFWGPGRATTRGRWVLATGLLAVSTGCQGLNLFSIQDDRRLGEQAYVQVLEGQPLVVSGPDYELPRRVAERLVEAARYTDPGIVNAFEWEVSVIDDDQTVNAFALPGGKMAVYTGILPVAGGEAGLAVVMGHEIAHVLERHGTQSMTRYYGVAVMTEALFSGDAQALAELAGSLVQLRYGRDAELEADRRGLMIMARAGYDPREAVEFWTRMSNLGGSSPPEFFSTHPDDDRRIGQLQSLMPEAVSIYDAVRASPPPR